MAKDPATLWYWNDWHSGTILMSRHLKGCYMDLLHAQFNHGPLSLEEIKTCLGSDFGTSWPAIQKKFKQNEVGLFFNERLGEEINKRKDFVTSRRTNGSMGGRPKKPSGYPNGKPKNNLTENENEDENRIKDESENFGKSENLLLIPEMFLVFKKNNPTYLGSIELDYKPLFKIASFFCEIGKLTGSPDLHKEKILGVWEAVSVVISKDNFYKQKPLSTISNQIQAITQISLNGKATSKNGKQDYGSKERGNQLDRLFTERYGSGGSTVG